MTDSERDAATRAGLSTLYEDAKLKKLCESFDREWRTSHAEYAKEIIDEGDLDHDLQEMLEFVVEWGDDLRRLLHVAPHADKQTI